MFSIYFCAEVSLFRVQGSRVSRDGDRFLRRPDLQRNVRAPRVASRHNDARLLCFLEAFARQGHFVVAWLQIAEHIISGLVSHSVQL